MGAKVSVISMGPPRQTFALREALAMGADEAILCDRQGVAARIHGRLLSTLASAIRKLPLT